MPPSIAREPTPDWLNKKNHPAAFPQAGSAGGGTGPMPPPPALQPSVGTAMAQKMSNVSVAAPAVAPAPSAGSASCGPVSNNAASSARAPELSGSETDDEDVELTPEEQEKAELVKNINEVIARCKAAGFSFSGKIETAAVATFLDAKDVFDAAQVDITDCAGTSRKISKKKVDDKLAELRKAAEENKRLQAMVPAQGESQFEFGSDNDEEEEEEKSETEEDAEDYTTYNEAQLDAVIARMKAELAVVTKQHEVGPVKVVLKNYNLALNDEKKTIERDEYLRRKNEINDVKEYFTEDVRKKKTLVYPIPTCTYPNPNAKP